MKLFSRVYGEGDPMIIIHGLFGMSDNWNTLGKRFAKNYNVHLIDLRNHGRSPHSDIFDYNTISRDILEYIDDNRLSNSIILGHSLGGKVAMKIAFDHTNYISKLIVVDISPREYDINFHVDLLNHITKIDLSNFIKRSEVDKSLSVYIKESTIRFFLMKNLYRDEQNKFCWRFNIKVLMKELEKIKCAEFLKGLNSIETLFLKGGRSNYITCNDEKLIFSHFTNVKIREIENTGHWLHAENPDLFYKKVMNFIEL